MFSKFGTKTVMLAPAVLAIVGVIGVNNMQSVASDIRRQTTYGVRYTTAQNLDTK